MGDVEIEAEGLTWQMLCINRELNYLGMNYSFKKITLFHL